MNKHKYKYDVIKSSVKKNVAEQQLAPKRKKLSVVQVYALVTGTKVEAVSDAEIKNLLLDTVGGMPLCPTVGVLSSMCTETELPRVKEKQLAEHIANTLQVDSIKYPIEPIESLLASGRVKTSELPVLLKEIKSTITLTNKTLFGVALLLNATE